MLVSVTQMSYLIPRLLIICFTNCRNGTKDVIVFSMLYQIIIVKLWFTLFSSVIVLEFLKINLIDVYNIMMCQTETVGVAYVLPLEFSYVNVMINIFIVAVK